MRLALNTACANGHRLSPITTSASQRFVTSMTARSSMVLPLCAPYSRLVDSAEALPHRHRFGEPQRVFSAVEANFLGLTNGDNRNVVHLRSPFIGVFPAFVPSRAPARADGEPG